MLPGVLQGLVMAHVRPTLITSTWGAASRHRRKGSDTRALELVTILALGLTSLPGALVVRTSSPGPSDRLYGWRLHDADLEPLTAAEVFDALCTDIGSGDLISPESDVDYCVPADLGPKATTLGHHH